MPITVYPFAVSLNPTVQLSARDNEYTLSHRASGMSASGNVHPQGHSEGAMLVLPASTAMETVLAQLQKGTTTTDSLIQSFDHSAATPEKDVTVTLQQLEQRGWLNYSVLPLATAMPMGEAAQLNRSPLQWTDARVRLSQDSTLRPQDGAMMLSSPQSNYQVKLLDWRASGILAQLAQPHSLGQLTPPPQVGPETAYQFLNLLWATGFLIAEPEFLEPIEASTPEIQIVGSSNDVLADTNTDTGTSLSVAPSVITPSRARSGNVYALGSLNYDFGDETRRDRLQQKMVPVDQNGIRVPPDPYDARQMVEHLDQHPEDSQLLIWTLTLDQNTVYALDPQGPFTADIYEMFLLMLNGQQQPQTSLEFVERISVPARQTQRTVELFSGENIPVVTVHNVRGMYGWTVNALVASALASVLARTRTETADEAEAAEDALLQQALTSFLRRVYYDLHNVGQLSRDRALNFATTNIFQATTTFAEAIADGRQLDEIGVEKSPYCRMNSDCWDVKLTFFDPENEGRSRKAYHFTIDVSDQVPVTVGKIKSWSLPSKQQGR